MKFTYVCLLALFGSSLGAKLRGNNVPAGGNQELNTIVNANVGHDLVGNLGLNAALELEKENEKSASFSNSISKEDHSDSQEVEISISFNIDLPKCHDDSSSSEEEKCKKHKKKCKKNNCE